MPIASTVVTSLLLVLGIAALTFVVLGAAVWVYITGGGAHRDVRGGDD